MTDPDSWFPAGSPAFRVWMCGRCSTELEPESTGLACPQCGSLYTDTGVFLTDSEDPDVRVRAVHDGRPPIETPAGDRA